jgi:hypothetical protein
VGNLGVIGSDAKFEAGEGLKILKECLDQDFVNLARAFHADFTAEASFDFAHAGGFEKYDGPVLHRAVLRQSFAEDSNSKNQFTLGAEAVVVAQEPMGIAVDARDQLIAPNFLADLAFHSAAGFLENGGNEQFPNPLSALGHLEFHDWIVPGK